MPASGTTRTKNSASQGTSNLDSDQLFEFYRQMLRVRRFEERAGQLYGMGQIGGFCHLYVGQEAIAIGVQALLTDADKVITAYREHGHLLAAGVEPRVAMAELTGRRDGVSGGKGGSMHMFSIENNFYGGHGIVGAHVPVGTGLAFAMRYRDEPGMAAIFFGDGASNQGQVYESFNMAALWNLPCLYVIENNLYAMGTSVERSSAQTELFRRGESMGIEGISIDGMDILAVHEATSDLVAKIRAGGGPRLIEMRTYRYRGHSMSDPAKYRTREEVDDVREHLDPIDRLGRILLNEHGATEDDLKAIDAEVREEIVAASEFADQNPEPEERELYTDVLRESSVDAR